MPMIDRQGVRGHHEWIAGLKRGSGWMYRKHLFFSRVEKTEKHPECWTWIGWTDKGKPSMKVENSRTKRATAISAKIHGMRGSGWVAGCGNPLCVRPDHLVLDDRALRGAGRHGIDIVYTLHANIAGDQSLRVGYIIDKLGGSRFTLWRWRKANPGKLFNGRTNGKH